MATSDLDKARKLLRKRKFSKIIQLLEPQILLYRDSFAFHYILGTACLYVEDISGADTYFKKARQMKINDVKLILSQAVLFLRKGYIDRALSYYLDALTIEPNNKEATKFLSLLNKYGEPDIISEWNHNGKILQFYPELPKDYSYISWIVAIVFAVGLLFCTFNYTQGNKKQNARNDLSSLELSINEKKNNIELGVSDTTYRYILTKSEVDSLYLDAQKFYNEYNDNECQKCINKLLNSNASIAIRQKAKLLMSYLEEPVFESKLENYSYKSILQDIYLYENCWVVWNGRVTNIVANENEVVCDFLVGYDTMKNLEGRVPLKLSASLNLDETKPLKVMAKIVIENDGIVLFGKSVYQPLTGNKLD